MERNYEASYMLTSESGRKVKRTASFIIADSAAFQYGNHQMMHMEDDRGFIADYDLRYDKRYHRRDELDFILKFISDFYDGKNGAWKASYIKVHNRVKLQ